MAAVMDHTTFKIDKTNWKPIKFGEVVAEPKEICKDIVAEGIENVVGLEHIDTGDLHLRKSATIEKSTTFSKKFRKGDVLFGRRRAYLKKAAQADFDGIFSGDITVFRAKKDLSSDLLPFIVNNDKFFDYAVKHSAGGLSPRVKFKDLANYEFLFPPKAEQARLAELLWSVDAVIEKEKVVLKRLEIILDSLFQQFRTKNTQWEKVKIGDIMNFNYGKALKESDRIEGEYPVITSSGLQGTHTDYITNGPGIVVGRKGNVGQVTWIERNFWTTDTAYYITIKSTYARIPMKFYFYLLRAANLQKLSIATAVPGLNRDDALMTAVFLPEKKEIATYLKKFESVESEIRNLNEKLTATQLLQKSLINQLF
jgi:type I restriction enzyme S subunit